MSSMRNAVQRRNHKERSQPEERKKLGLLEKHKDYSARAKDYNTKKRKLTSLKQKVLEKNPDEFYFGMMSRSGGNITVGNKGKSTGTVDGKREAQVLSTEAVRLFKTQDLGYVRTMRNQVRKEVETLEKMGVNEGTGRKVVYCDDEGDVERKADGEDSEEDEGEEKKKVDVEERKRRKLQKREKEKIVNRLEVARERLRALTEAEEALDLQRAKMAKTPTTANKEGVKHKVRARKR